MPRRRRPDPGGRAPRPDILGALYPTLDLHGLTAEEAVSTARAWLAERRRGGELTVRVVTGRGLHSPGPAVLPGAIEALLESLGSAVAGFEREPGGGAYRVRLRRTGPTRGTGAATVRAPTHDPALVREAQEALAELGVAPTPALLEAEIQRILRRHGSEGT